MARVVLVTGGSGFIGSALVRVLVAQTEWRVVNIDKLTYAVQPAALAGITEGPRYRFVQADIADPGVVEQVVASESPEAVIHLAAETHVDRSIADPMAFLNSNVMGTGRVLEACRQHTVEKIMVVSTDEVYGPVEPGAAPDHLLGYNPSSPYSASKAAADHLANAWHRTYGLPVVVTHSCNNYGPFQHDEKLIPRVIGCLKAGLPIPLYGDGQQQRDWLWVDDHVAGLVAALEAGQPGEHYHFGVDGPVTNLHLVEMLCDLADEHGIGPVHPARQLITFVDDRPGHDFGYWLPLEETRVALGWRPTVDLEAGLKRLLTMRGQAHSPQGG